MQKEQLQLQEIKLIGIKVRTCNQDEISPITAKIFPCVQRYFYQTIALKIGNRKNPGITFCTYSEYDSDHMGYYTYFIGEEVEIIDDIPQDLSSLVIPSQKYTKFTTEPGSMPIVLIQTWQKIWQMPVETIGGTRNYIVDFEIYDERAINPQNAVVDIYVGVS